MPEGRMHSSHQAQQDYLICLNIKIALEHKDKDTKIKKELYSIDINYLITSFLKAWLLSILNQQQIKKGEMMIKKEEM